MQLKTSSPDRQPQGNKSTWRHRSQLLTRFLLCSPTSLAPPPTARLRRWQRADSGRDPARRPPLRRAQAAALRDRARPPPPSAANSDTAGRGPQRGPEGGTRSSAAGHGAAAGPLRPPAFCLGPAPTARPGLGSRPGPDPGRPLSARPLAAPPPPGDSPAGPGRLAPLRRHLPPPPRDAPTSRAERSRGGRATVTPRIGRSHNRLRRWRGALGWRHGAAPPHPAFVVPPWRRGLERSPTAVFGGSMSPPNGDYRKIKRPGKSVLSNK